MSGLFAHLTSWTRQAVRRRSRKRMERRLGPQARSRRLLVEGLERRELLATIQFIDNDAAGYTTVRGSNSQSDGWTVVNNLDPQTFYGGTTAYSARRVSPSVNVDKARWTFTVTPGQYRVATTWNAHANRASDAPYTIFDDASTLTTIDVNQRVSPQSVAGAFQDGSIWWSSLGGVHTITSDKLIVELTDDANGYVMSDAVRIEKVADAAGISVTPTSGLVTTESGGTASFQVKLTSQPTANVSIPVASSDATEGTVSVPTLTFTPANWNQDQTVTVTGVDDGSVDGNIAYSILLGATTSADANYHNLNPTDVSVTNQDNDSPAPPPPASVQYVDDGGTGFSSQRGSGSSDGWTFMSNLSTSGYYGGDTGYSAKTTGGTADTARWTFTVTPGRYRVSTTWSSHANRATNAPYTIYDGNQSLGTVRVNQELPPSQGAGAFQDGGIWWSNLGNPVQVSGNQLIVELSDDANEYVLADAVRIEKLADITSVSVTPTSGLVTTESGGTATFSVQLTAAPTNDVTIPVSSSNTAEGTIAVNQLTFTAANWNQAQVVTVTGVDDGSVDGNVAFSIVLGVTTSADSRYNNLNPTDVSVTNQDNDTPPPPPPAVIQYVDDGGTGFSTQKGSGSSDGWTFLTNLSTSSFYGGDTGYSARTGGGGLDTARWTFTVTPGKYRVSTTWNAYPNRATNAPYTIYNGGQAVGTVRVNQEVDPSQSAGAFQEGGIWWSNLGTLHNIAGNQLIVELSDDANEFVMADAVRIEKVAELYGFAVNPESGLTTTEAGATASFQVSLNTMPTSDVTLPVASSDTSEGTLVVNNLVFTPQNWNVPQTVTITGVDDGLVDGRVNYSIVLGVSSSADAHYDGLNPADVTVQNRDDDGPPVVIMENTDPEFVADRGSTAFDGWTANAQAGVHTSAKGSGWDVARWRFSVTPGEYRISTKWANLTDRATNAPFSIYDGAGKRATVLVNQKVATSSTAAAFQEDGAWWADLGTSHLITTGDLIIELTDVADGVVVADAIRVERLGNLPPNPTAATYLGAFDFGTASSPVAPRSTPVSEVTTYNAGRRYGWLAGTVQSADRGTSNTLDRDLNFTRNATFAVDVPNGTYTVDLILGDRGNVAHDLMQISLEGQLVDTVSTAAKQIVGKSYQVNVNDGQVTLGLVDAGGSDLNVTILALRLYPVGTQLTGSDGPFWPVYSDIVGASFYEPYVDGNGFTVHAVESAYQRGITAIRVLLPANYNPQIDYKVIYVLPVESGDGTKYGNGLVEVRNWGLHNQHNVIFVAPNFSDIPWYADHVSDPLIRQETYFRTVVVPFVEKNYSTLGTKEGRLLLGFSKSGWGAFSMLLRYPDYFGKAHAWDSPMGMQSSNDIGGNGYSGIVGSEANFQNYSVSRLVATRGYLLQNQPSRLSMDGYYFDFTRSGMANLHNLMVAYSVPHLYFGGSKRSHTWNSGWVPAGVQLLLS